MLWRCRNDLFQQVPPQDLMLSQVVADVLVDVIPVVPHSSFTQGGSKPGHVRHSAPFIANACVSVAGVVLRP